MIPFGGSSNPYALPGQTTQQQQITSALQPQQSSSTSNITIGPGPAPTTTSTSPTVDPNMVNALAMLASGMGGLFGMGQNQNSPTNDQATLPAYLQSPYDNGMYNGSPMAQALNQYSRTK